MNIRKNQPLLTACLLATVSTLALTSPHAASAQARDAQMARVARTYNFDIAAKALPQAIAEFSAVTGMQVLYTERSTFEHTAPALRGSLTADQALGQLLAGSGLAPRFTAANAVTLEPIPTNSGVLNVAPASIEGSNPAQPADRQNSIDLTYNEILRKSPTTARDLFQGETAVSVGGGIPLAQKVYVNGVEENNLAVSIDGARQNNKTFHHTGTTVIDPSLLKAVRIDKGVAPADAGPGALGGAILYETVDVDDVLARDRTIGGFTTASFDTNTSTFTNGYSGYGRAQGFEFLGFAKWGYGDDYEAGNGRQVPGTGTNLASFLGKGAYESISGHRVELSSEYVRDNARRPYRPNIGQLTNRGNPLERGYDLKRQNFAATYNTPHADGLFDPKISIGYSGTDVEVPDPAESVGETKSLSGKIENDFNLTLKDRITVGFDFYRDNAYYDDNTQRESEEKALNAGIYAQARLTPLDPLRLSFGLRNDHQTFTGINGTDFKNDGVSGNASVAYDIIKPVTLKAGYSNVWGGIVLGENFVFNPNWNYTQDIKPIRSENVTLGAEFKHEGFSVDAGVFRSEFDNARKSNWTNGPYQPSDFKTQGYTVGTGYNWGLGFARVSFTDTDIRVNGRATESDATQYLGAPLGRIFALEAAHRIEDTGLTFGGVLDAALKNDSTKAPGQAALPAYEVVNLYSEYQPAELSFLTLRLEINNLFDETYADRATYGQEFGNVRPMYEPGRSFMLMAKAKF